jgi:hypothetical protein
MKIVRAFILADVENGMSQSSGENARGTRDSDPNGGGPDGSRTENGAEIGTVHEFITLQTRT